jgi:flagella basal body P-ring formation protein FlgA
MLSLIFLLSALLYAGSVHASEVHVAFKPIAAVPKQIYTLGDVADITGTSDAVVADLGRMKLGYAPRVGVTERVAASTLRWRATQQNGRLRFTWGGADEIKIQRASSVYESGELLTAASRALETQLGGRGLRVELRAIEPLPKLKVPAGAVTWRVRPFASHATVRRHTSVMLDIMLDGEFYSSVKVNFEVQAFGEVSRLRTALAKDSVLRCDDVERATYDIAKLEFEPARFNCQGPAQRLRRALEPGAILVTNHLATVDPVSQGEAVLLRFEDGPIQLELPAVALSNGALGQKIQVRAVSAREAVLAQVTGPGKVQMTGNR